MADPTPEEPTALTPDALESLLSGIDHEAFVAFVSGLRERGGWDVERRGSVLVATRPDGDRERVLVWTDDRSRLERLRDVDPEAPVDGPVDAVVTRERDADTAAVVAGQYGARVVDTEAIHDRLLYAIDRENSRALCAAHFDRQVAPRPAPGTDEREDAAAASSAVGSRALIAGAALLALVVAGAAGLPGAFPGSTPDAAPSIGPGDPLTGTQPGDTPPGGAPGSPTATTSTPTPESIEVDPGTPPPEECSGCPSLLEFGDDPPTVPANATTTITVTLYNPSAFGLSDVSVELRPPGENWSVTPVDGTGVAELPPAASRSVAWDVTAPPGTEGNDALDGVSVYADGERTLRTARTYDVTITSPGRLPPDDPPCTEALGPLIGGGSCHLLTLDAEQPELAAGTTTTVSGTLYNPRDAALADGRVELRPPGENWSVTPVNGTTFDRLPPGEVRRASWNLTPPITASGTYTIPSNTTYTRTAGPGRANRTAPHSYPVSVAAAEAARPPEKRPCNLESGPINPAGPCYLLVFADDPPEVAAGTTTTVTGRLYNPRDYALVNGSVTLAPPGANWSVTPVRGTTFGRLAPGEVQVARWNLTVPASAGGTVDLRGVTNYTRLGGPGDANVSLARRYPVAVITADASDSTVVNSATDAAPDLSVRVAP
jgi:hypothetical protein